MGDYGVNLFGSNGSFDYNEIYESNYKPDPGCGCSGGGKWWGTLNDDIVDNAFVDDSPAGGKPSLARQRELRHAHLGQLLLYELRYGNR